MTPTATVSGTREYVYGVGRRGELAATRAEGVGGADVRLVEHGDLAALVSRLPAGGEIKARRRDLLRHSEVLQEAAARATVVPLRFGTVLADGESVEDDLLEGRRDELLALVDSVDGLVELNVRAYYREDAVLAEIVAGDARVAKLREATLGGAAHRAHVELGEAVVHALDRRRAADAERILRAARKLARNVSVQERRADYEVLRASFLVERAEVAPFDRAMDEVARELGDTVLFKYVGPLPPHSFVSLTHGGR